MELNININVTSDADEIASFISKLCDQRPSKEELAKMVRDMNLASQREMTSCGIG